MSRFRAVVGVLAMAAVAVPVFAQSPGTPGDVPAIPERPQSPVSKSDQDRIVGKVLDIDRAAGLVKLDSDEGVVTVRPSARMLAAIRVGDTVSLVRSADAPDASPRGARYPVAPRGR